VGPRRAAKGRRPEYVTRVELTGELDAHAAEALALEVRRLVRDYVSGDVDVRVATTTVARKKRSA
jgi:hypothetical protein